jgi:hypothetical protein
MSKEARVGASIIVFFLAICLRIAMSFFPSLPLCCLFWATIATANILAAYYLWLPGLACNAAAMIANGGFMPVFGEKVTPGGAHIQGTPDAALQILCDQFWGFSIGDFLLFAALALTAVRSFVPHTRALGKGIPQ